MAEVVIVCYGAEVLWAEVSGSVEARQSSNSGVRNTHVQPLFYSTKKSKGVYA